MEQLPVGGTAFSSAFNGCTMEQLPTGSHTASPAQVASTAQARGFTSPAAMMRQGQGRLSSPGQQQGQEQEQSRGQGVAQGLGQGMHGIGLSARNAAAAFCSARWQTAEPRNPYRSATTNLGKHVCSCGDCASCSARLSCTYLAHHELESVLIIMIIYYYHHHYYYHFHYCYYYYVRSCGCYAVWGGSTTASFLVQGYRATYASKVACALNLTCCSLY